MLLTSSIHRLLLPPFFVCLLASLSPSYAGSLDGAGCVAPEGGESEDAEFSTIPSSPFLQNRQVAPRGTKTPIGCCGPISDANGLLSQFGKHLKNPVSTEADMEKLFTELLKCFEDRHVWPGVPFPSKERIDRWCKCNQEQLDGTLLECEFLPRLTRDNCGQLKNALVLVDLAGEACGPTRTLKKGEDFRHVVGVEGFSCEESGGRGQVRDPNSPGKTTPIKINFSIGDEASSGKVEENSFMCEVDIYQIFIKRAATAKPSPNVGAIAH